MELPRLGHAIEKRQEVAAAAQRYIGTVAGITRLSEREYRV
jgi:hypothetical protein